MTELLNNPAIQAALVVVIVTALNALVAWLKKTFPTQAASVEANWCYLQPLVEGAMAAANRAIGSGSVLTGTNVAAIVEDAVTAFKAQYKQLEGKSATSWEIESARNELLKAVARVAVGG